MIIIVNSHKAIISLKMFDTVQNLNENMSNKERNKSGNYF